MNIELRATVALDIPAGQLRERAFAWAKLAGFVPERDEPDRWTFRRGSALSALWTVNVRKVPTTLEVVHLPELRSAGCFLRCSSWSQTEMPWERRTLEGDFQDLVDYLTATGPRSLVDEETERRWQPGRDERVRDEGDGYAG